MTDHIDFWFDFGSPNSYLAYRALPSIESRLGPVFRLRPALLGGVFKATNNRSPVEAFAQIPAKLAYDRMEIERFSARHSLDRFQHNPYFPINTLALMRGAVAAKRLDVFAPYIEAVYIGMWEQRLDMGNVDVIRTTLDGAGLPADRIFAEAQSPEAKQELVDATGELVDRGAFGIPTFFVGDEMYFGKDRLREVEDEFVRQRGGAG